MIEGLILISFFRDHFYRYKPEALTIHVSKIEMKLIYLIRKTMKYKDDVMENRIKQYSVLIFMIALAVSGCTSKITQQDAKSSDLDFNDILWHARRAKAAYEEPDVIKRKFPNTFFIGENKKKNIQYFVEKFHDEKLQVISIRGTDNLKNFKQDVDYIPAKDKRLGIYVHRGFDRDTRHVLNDVLPKLNRDYDVKVTGHSLGAAIASLLMIYLHEEGFTIKPSVNFGQPKFTNKKGANKYSFLPMLRVVNKNDLVPLVPPVTLLDSVHGKYVHFKPEVILLKGVHYVYLDDHDASRSLPGSFWLNIGRESIKDHSMAKYLADIITKLESAVQVPYKDREKYISK